MLDERAQFFDGVVIYPKGLDENSYLCASACARVKLEGFFFFWEGQIRIRLQLQDFFLGRVNQNQITVNFFTLYTTTLTQPTSQKTTIHHSTTDMQQHTTSHRHHNNTTNHTPNTYQHIPHHTNTHSTHTPHFFSGYAHISPYLCHNSSLFSRTSHLSSGFFHLSPFPLASLIATLLSFSRTSPFCLEICGPMNIGIYMCM